MKNIEEMIRQLQIDSRDRLLEVARFAEQGMNASAVIHEVRQPLTALSMALQMALDCSRRCDAEMQDIIEESIRLAGRTEMLLDRARDFMSPSRERAEINIGEAFDRVMSIFHWHLRTSDNISIQCHVEAELPDMIGDRGQVEQAIGNLISNAIDAVTAKGGGVIHVIARSGADDAVEMIVADNGTGIPPEARDQIFVPFFSTKSRTRGTGLGLYIVRHMAQDYRGDARLLSPEELDALGLGRLSTGVLISLQRDRDSAVTT